MIRRRNESPTARTTLAAAGSALSSHAGMWLVAPGRQVGDLRRDLVGDDAVGVAVRRRGARRAVPDGQRATRLKRVGERREDGQLGRDDLAVRAVEATGERDEERPT